MKTQPFALTARGVLPPRRATAGEASEKVRRPRRLRRIAGRCLRPPPDRQSPCQKPRWRQPRVPHGVRSRAPRSAPSRSAPSARARRPLSGRGAGRGRCGAGPDGCLEARRRSGRHIDSADGQRQPTRRRPASFVPSSPRRAQPSRQRGAERAGPGIPSPRR